MRRIMVIAALLALACAGCGKDDATKPRAVAREWRPLQSGLRLSFSDDGAVYALAVHQENLIAGGDFDRAGDLWARTIARWNGAAWDSLPGTPGSWVRNIASGEDGLFVCGLAGHSSAFVSRFDGFRWEDIGDPAWQCPVPGIVDLVVFRDDLIAAGMSRCSGPFAWRGGSWSRFGSGPVDGITTLAVYQDNLIVGGVFPTVESDSVDGIARWTGNSWESLGLGFGKGGEVTALGEYQGSLIAAGGTNVSGTIGRYRVCRWDGTTWTQLGGLFDGPIFALSVYDGQIIAGGMFTQIDGSKVNRIACWDGGPWLPLGEGMDGPVMALCVYDGALIAGGRFHTAGADSAIGIAAWE
jgi:hypothetical protein